MGAEALRFHSTRLFDKERRMGKRITSQTAEFLCGRAQLA